MNRQRRTVSEAILWPTLLLAFFCGVVVLFGSVVAAVQAQSRDEAPARRGTCALYYTHQHVGALSYQLTCRDPQPESVTVRPRQASQDPSQR